MGNSPQNSKKGDQTEHGNISIIYKKKKTKCRISINWNKILFLVKQFLIKAKEEFNQRWENPLGVLFYL